MKQENYIKRLAENNWTMEMGLLGHLRVIVPCGINPIVMASTRRNWIAYLKGNYLQKVTTKAIANKHVFFQRAKMFQCAFLW